MSYTAQERDINYLFSNDKVYSIPLFQRDYVWESKQWKLLVEDLLLAINNKENHFLGSCVIDDVNGRLDIIDGQQRLITIYTFFIGMAIHLKSNYCNLDKSKKNDIFDYIKTLLIRRNGVDPKCARIDTKFNIIGTVIDELEKENFEYNVCYDLISSYNGDESIKNLLLTSLSFFNNKKIGTTDYDFDFVNFYNYFRNMRIIEVYSNNTADAYKVFETLNARGVMLTQIQLLKAYIFKHLKTSDKIVDVSTKWNQLEVELENVNPDSFLMHSLKCITNYKKLKEDSLYEVIVEKHKEYTADDHYNFIDTLVKIAKKYKKYDTVSLNSKIVWDNLISFCLVKNIKVYRPLFISLDLKRDIIGNKFDEICNVLYCFIMLNSIRKTYSNKVDNSIADTANKIYTCNTQLGILNYFYGFILSYQYLIPKEECINDIKAMRYSNKADADNNSSKSIILMFKPLYENSQKDADSENDYNKVNVEHILNDSAFEKKKMNLGNLILLSKKMNDDVMNKEYTEKRAFYLSSSIEYVKEFATNNASYSLEDSVNRTNTIAQDIYNLYSIDFDNINDKVKRITFIEILKDKYDLDYSYLYEFKFSEYVEKINLRNDLTSEKKNEVLAEYSIIENS